jgi:hypothetical protein
VGFNLRPALDLRMIGQELEGRSCPGDVSDEEWAFCALQLTLMKEVHPSENILCVNFSTVCAGFFARAAGADGVQRSAAVARSEHCSIKVHDRLWERALE